MIDWTKPVQTRDGRKVRVLCTDAPGDFPVVGIVEAGDIDGAYVSSWRKNGRLSLTDDECYQYTHDLSNVPEPPVTIKRWVNIYDDHSYNRIHATKRSADENAWSARLACVEVEITYRPGEGL